MISNKENYFLVLSHDVPTKVCNQCGNNVYEERELDEYPYYCPHCDENKYDFEVSDDK